MLICCQSHSVSIPSSPSRTQRCSTQQCSRNKPSGVLMCPSNDRSTVAHDATRLQAGEHSPNRKRSLRAWPAAPRGLDLLLTNQNGAAASKFSCSNTQQDNRANDCHSSCLTDVLAEHHHHHHPSTHQHQHQHRHRHRHRHRHPLLPLSTYRLLAVQCREDLLGITDILQHARHELQKATSRTKSSEPITRNN